jgi:hypothetical protein
MAKFGTDSLKANLTNPQREYLWEVLVPTPVGEGQTETFQVRAQSSSVPGRSNPPIKIPYKQTAGIVVAGKLTYDQTWECTFVEGEDRKIYDAVYSWQQAIVNDVAGVGVGDPLYKTDVYIILQTTAGGNSLQLKLKGAWIQSIGNVALTYAGADTVKYTVTFAFDSTEKMS